MHLVAYQSLPLNELSKLRMRDKENRVDTYYIIFGGIVLLFVIAAVSSWFFWHAWQTSLAILVAGTIGAALLLLVLAPWVVPQVFPQTVATTAPPTTQQTAQAPPTPTPVVVEKVVTQVVERVITATPMPTLPPTYTPYPTYTPFPTPTPAPPTATTVAMMSVVGSDQAQHFARLEQLDPVFRSQGLGAWLKAAGVTWETLTADARQIEEETSPSKRVLAAGVQVRGTNVRVNWPVIVTTDRPNEVTETSTTVKHQPDLRNPSVLYTNVVLNGQGTIWIDGTNWGQFTSVLRMEAVLQATPVSVVTTSVSTATPMVTAMPQKSTTLCLTVSQLDARYGIVRDAQGATNGLLYDKSVLAGVVIRVNSDQVRDLESKGWTIQGTNPLIKSAWSPESCRPLTQ